MKLAGYDHCSFCGSTSIAWATGEAKYTCNTCHKTTFLNIAAAAGCFLYDEHGSVLLAKRGRDPWKGKYDEPGGFMDLADRNAEETVVRELQEELGITIQEDRLHYLANHTMTYHYKGRDVPDCALVFYAKISEEEKKQITAADDVAAVRWVNEEDFDDSMMATPSHAVLVRKVFAIAKENKNRA